MPSTAAAERRSFHFSTPKLSQLDARASSPGGYYNVVAMDCDASAARHDPQGGDPACWVDQVRDCCGTLESEPHRPGCADADDGERTS